MKFVLHAAALNCDDSSLALIDRLIDRIADEVHRVDVPDADLVVASRWYQNARTTRQKLLLSALAVPPRKALDVPGPHTKSIEVDSPESVHLAEKMAHTPLVVLVEDREADGVLLEIVVDELGSPSLRALWARAKEVTPRAVEITTAGGVGAIPGRVDRAAKDAEGEGRPIRLFVLFDSDCKWPGDAEVTTSSEAVRQACDRHLISYHMWKKRCSENYIPDQVFEAARADPFNTSHVDRFDALLRRTPTQRDHFPVKDGLSKEERFRACQAGLYDDSEEEDLAVLEKPLFPKRPRPLQRLQAERRDSFTAAGLRERDGEGELDALLAAISREL